MSKKNDNALLIETATTVRLMNERLFGDGSDGAGALAKLYSIVEKHNDAAVQALKDHAVDDDINFKAVNKSVNKVDKKVVWFSGGIAVAGAIGTIVLGALVAHFASIAAAAQAVAK